MYSECLQPLPDKEDTPVERQTVRVSGLLRVWVVNVESKTRQILGRDLRSLLLSVACYSPLLYIHYTAYDLSVTFVRFIAPRG